jgi:hypothetical protein
MTEEDYIKCVRISLSGAKVFLQRKPYEVRVNPYMKVVLPAWKANHDFDSISVESFDIFSNSEVFLSKKVLLSGGEVLIKTTCLVAFVKGICKVK